MCFIGHAGSPFGSGSNARKTPHREDGLYAPLETNIRAVLQDIAAELAEPAGQLKIFNDLLQAISAKLVVKIRELDRATGDLRNLIRASAIPAIFVDENLRVRDFTPAIERVCTLCGQDVGRSLLDFACSFNHWDLQDDFRRLAETGETVERYVEGRGGRVHYSVRIMPNFCRDNSFGGATLTFAEIMTCHSGRA
jgi:two-component system CheB/CheR fusion protein